MVAARTARVTAPARVAYAPQTYKGPVMKNISPKTLTSSFALATLLLVGGAGCAGDETSEQEQPIKCQGINDCKGTSECAGPDGANDCQGKNECEGMGWVSVESEADCTSQGGTVI